MLLTTLHWPDEIRSTSKLILPAEDFAFKPAELKMAEQLVEAMTDAFDPSRYRDEYREALLSVITAKVEGVEIAEPAPAEESTKIVDLMKLLEASVKAAADQRTAGSVEPVSVADAKKERDARPATANGATTASTARAGKASTAKDAAAADAAEARPARRRKSA
jgi:DNA end-binding protein Ku